MLPPLDVVVWEHNDWNCSNCVWSRSNMMWGFWLAQSEEWGVGDSWYQSHEFEPHNGGRDYLKIKLKKKKEYDKQCWNLKAEGENSRFLITLSSWTNHRIAWLQISHLVNNKCQILVNTMLTAILVNTVLVNVSQTLATQSMVMINIIWELAKCRISGLTYKPTDSDRRFNKIYSWFI